MIGAIIGGIAAAAFFLALQLVLFRVLGKLAIDASGQGNMDSSTIWGLSDALSNLPAWMIQLMNWMHLDQCIMIVTTALIFAAVIKFLGGAVGGGN